MSSPSVFRPLQLFFSSKTDDDMITKPQPIKESFSGLEESKSRDDEEGRHDEHKVDNPAGAFGRGFRVALEGAAESSRQKIRDKCGDGLSPYEMSSAMARMRDSETQKASALSENPSPSPSACKGHKSHEEVKVEKQRRWKKQMKLAQRRKKEERRSLELGGDLTQDFMDARELFGAMLYKILPVACGNTQDVSDSDDNSYGSVETGESMSSEGNRGSSRNFERRRGRSSERKPSKSKPKPKTSSSKKKRRERRAGASEDEEKPESNDKAIKKVTLPPEDDSYAKPKGDKDGTPLSPEALSNANTGATDQAHYTYAETLLKRLSSPPSETSSLKELIESESVSDVSNSNSNVSGVSATVKPRDKNFVKAYIQDLMNQGFIMLWHKEDSDMNATSIRVGLKPGYQMPNGKHCGPRLVWSDIKRKNDKFGMNLFDIRSLELANPIQLGDFPFAMPGRSIFLKMTNGQDFVFEAPSEDAAFRFVHGMRWIVARLTFNVVIGNSRVSCELLDLGLTDIIGTKTPKSLLEEAKWMRAMDDVTVQMVDKSAVFGEI